MPKKTKEKIVKVLEEVKVETPAPAEKKTKTAKKKAPAEVAKTEEITTEEAI